MLHIDKSQLFREGLRQILDGSEFQVEFGTSSLSDGLAQAISDRHDLVVIDPAGFGEIIPEFLVAVRTIPKSPRVVILTESVLMPRLVEALSAGADGYLTKDISGEALKHSLQLVMIGEKVFPTSLALSLVDHRFNETRPGAANRSELSDRERDILICLANGKPNKAIAIQLDISEGAVKVHLKSVLNKIGATNRTQAAIWAHQRGITATSDVHHRLPSDVNFKFKP